MYSDLFALAFMVSLKFMSDQYLDQAYVIDLDTVILPTAMVNLSDSDTIIDPYDTVVQFYAAHLAKYYEQSFGEAEIYLQQYKQKTQAVLVSTFTRRIPTPYSTPF
jgi:hypothetical protein